jgi:polar amino acid transport system substrate-binding protein
MGFIHFIDCRDIARRFGAPRAVLCLLLCALSAGAMAADPGTTTPLRVAVYDVEPYGGRDRDGLFTGASVDLWRRVAEDRHWQYELTLVSRMDDLLSGLEGHAYDVGIGAISITPERLARVDFSYPTHRSGVAAVFARRTGAASAFYDYGTAAGELGVLIIAILILLAVIGILMWWFERSYAKDSASESASAVTSWHEGVYWAVVTMTTVGYGDKTPKTHLGRALAVLWMVGSLVLVSLLTTNLIARMTVSMVEGTVANRVSDLGGKRLGAVSGSSGAEYLDAQRLAYRKYENLPDAFDAMTSGKVDAVVNSIGALQYLTRTRFADTIAPPHGVLAPAYMGFALPMNSALKRPLDRALTVVSASSEWRSVEDTYFGQ